MQHLSSLGLGQVHIETKLHAASFAAAYFAAFDVLTEAAVETTLVAVLQDKQFGRSVVITGVDSAHRNEKFCQIAREMLSSRNELCKAKPLRMHPWDSCAFMVLHMLEDMELVMFNKSVFKWFRTEFRIPGDRVCRMARRVVDQQFALFGSPLQAGESVIMSSHAIKTIGSKEFCVWCGKKSAKLKKCGRCLVCLYCSPECQRQHWQAEHKLDCDRVAEQAALQAPVRVLRVTLS